MSRKSKAEIKKTQQQTAERMKETRSKDAVYLRDVASNKLKWATQEKQKGLDLIKKYEENINNLTTQVRQLEGYIMALQDLIKTKSENKQDKE